MIPVYMFSKREKKNNLIFPGSFLLVLFSGLLKEPNYQCSDIDYKENHCLTFITMKILYLYVAGFLSLRIFKAICTMVVWLAKHQGYLHEN